MKMLSDLNLGGHIGVCSDGSCLLMSYFWASFWDFLKLYLWWLLPLVASHLSAALKFSEWGDPIQARSGFGYS